MFFFCEILFVMSILCIFEGNQCTARSAQDWKQTPARQRSEWSADCEFLALSLFKFAYRVNIWQHLLSKKRWFLVGHHCYRNLLAFSAKLINIFINWFLPCLACVVNFNIPVITASVAKVSYPRASGSNSALRDPRWEEKKTSIFRSTSKCFSWFVSPLFRLFILLLFTVSYLFLKRTYRIFMVEIFKL